MRNMELSFVQYMWEMNMGVSFIVGKEAANRMLPGGGTLIFTGATGAMRGRPPFIAFAQGKSGVRECSAPLLPPRPTALRGHVEALLLNPATPRRSAGMLAQSMAREFAPEGLHVAHVIIDGGVGGDRLRDAMGRDVASAVSDNTMLDPFACAESFWQLHLQQPSAWTQEMELRPAKETW